MIPVFVRLYSVVRRAILLELKRLATACLCLSAIYPINRGLSPITLKTEFNVFRVYINPMNSMHRRRLSLYGLLGTASQTRQEPKTLSLEVDQ